MLAAAVGWAVAAGADDPAPRRRVPYRVAIGAAVARSGCGPAPEYYVFETWDMWSGSP